MNKFITLIAVCLTFNLAFSQKIEIDFIIKNDSLQKKEKRDFIYLDQQTDISTAKYIGRIKATNIFRNLKVSPMLIAEKAQKKGANSFRFVAFKNENGNSELLIDAYAIDDHIKNLNENILPKNKIYFFGKDKVGKNTVEEFQVNGEVKMIPAFHYSVIEFDKEMKINKGKAFGAALKIVPKDKESVFINFSSFGASPAYMANGGMGLSFSGGSIIRMEKDTALLLTNIFIREE